MYHKGGDELKSSVRRVYLLDELRGFAIICMVVHHAFLDVGDVLQLSWGYDVFNALCVVQPLFWAIFIIISGICSRLSRNTVKRGIIVLACGLAVTFVTAVLMPIFGFQQCEIYFGILSCLGSCMIITGLLMPLIEKTNVFAGMIISAVLFFATYNISKGNLLFGLIDLPDALYQHDWLCPLGFYSADFFSADYFAIIPWLFMFLFGAFAGKFVKDGKLPEFCYKRRSAFLCLVGKNSLWVYLGHQVVLYAVFLLISIFI